MKIIHIIPTLGSGGAERLTVDLVNELSKKHDIYLVVLFGLDQALNTFFLSQVSPLVDVITFNKRRGPDFSIFWKLKNLIKRVKPDVINTHLSAVNYVLPFLGNPEISFIHTIHSEPRHEAKTKIEYWSRKLAYKKRLITPITISFDSQKSFQEYYNINNDILIFNGREQISVTPEIDSVRTVVNTIRKDKNTKVLISIGRFVPLKRQFLLASIINELVQEGENTGLILLGADDSVYATEVKNQIAELNCNQIITLGKVANVSDYLISVDAFCISSELEGMPMSYIEALSVGCIPISTPVGGLATLITKDIGFLAEDLSRSAIKESIRKYLNTPSSVLQQMKAAAYDQFEELFVISKTASQYITAYEKK